MQVVINFAFRSTGVPGPFSCRTVPGLLRTGGTDLTGLCGQLLQPPGSMRP